MVWFTNAHIWDGHSDDWVAASLCVEQSAIKGLSQDRKAKGAGTMDLAGSYVIPGLIDAHVHLCLDPKITSALDQGKLGDKEQFSEMASRANQMVRAGITTARDLGGGDWQSLVLRDRINQGELCGPRLLCAGQPITSPRGHCHFWGGEASNEEEALQVLEKQVAHSVDLIKVMATGGNLTPGSRPQDAQFSEEILRSIVETARSHDLTVAAHCHGVSGIRNAVAAGVRTIEHCSWVNDEGWGHGYDVQIVEAMVRQASWVSPTVNLGWRRHYGTAREKQLLKNFEHMRQAGVRLIASTDAGIPNVHHHDLPLALPVFARLAGLTPRETLVTASSSAASALGIDEVTGSLLPGHDADFLVLDKNPFESLEALVAPIEVFSRGVPVLGRIRGG